MSRLFEALSNAETQRRVPKIVPRAAVLPEVVPSSVIAETITPPEPTQELEAGLRLPVVVSEAVAVPETARGEAPPVKVFPPASVEGVPIEDQSPKAGPFNEVFPDIISPSDAAVEAAVPEPIQMAKLLAETPPRHAETLETCSVVVKTSPESRLVALTDPNCLGAEKFRALVARLDHLRKGRELKSFQVTSSVINEGKSVVSGNVAVTLAKYSGAKTLLIEGDLHRPTLAAQFGLTELRGLSHWWPTRDPELGQYVYKLNGMPLWFLAAGKPTDRPSDILRSARFGRAFSQLAKQFEWIVVDSTPMLPIVDANLWSRLVDGTLLVVREGLAPVKALKKGLQALDHPKLIGVVINEAPGIDEANYDGQYYGASKPRRAADQNDGPRAAEL